MPLKSYEESYVITTPLLENAIKWVMLLIATLCVATAALHHNPRRQTRATKPDKQVLKLNLTQSLKAQCVTFQGIYWH